MSKFHLRVVFASGKIEEYTKEFRGQTYKRRWGYARRWMNRIISPSVMSGIEVLSSEMKIIS